MPLKGTLHACTTKDNVTTSTFPSVHTIHIVLDHSAIKTFSGQFETIINANLGNIILQLTEGID